MHRTLTSRVERAPIRPGPLLLVVALLNTVVGLMVLAWPEITLTVLVFLFGIYLLLGGALRIFMALVTNETGARWLPILSGVVAIVFGLLTMREPFRTVEVIVTFVGIYWVVHGVFSLIAAADSETVGRSQRVADGLVAIIGGAILLAWPDPTVRVVALVVGVFLLGSAAALVALALTQRSAEQGGGQPPLAAA